MELLRGELEAVYGKANYYNRESGRGYQDREGTRGDLIAEIKVMVPKQLTEDEKAIYKKLSEISKFNPRQEINLT